MTKADSYVEPIFFPYGVADENEQIGCLANKQSGLDALHLKTGEWLWHTDQAFEPLIMVNNLLAAKCQTAVDANQLQIIFLDINHPQADALLSERLIFPQWVEVQSSDFECKIYVENKELIVVWEAHTFYKGGAPPGKLILQQASKDAEGVARIDMETGKVSMLAKTEAVAGKKAEVFEPVISLPYKKGFSWYSAPWTVGDQTFALLSDDTPQQITFLKVWQAATGKQILEEEIVKGGVFNFHVTRDGKYLFAQSADMENPSSLPEPEWQIFSLQPLKRLATLRLEPEFDLPAIINSHLYYLSQDSDNGLEDNFAIRRETIKARDLDSGKLLWEAKLQAVAQASPKALRQ
jgi:hypothetical protein